jgi:hypothetical protein
MRHSYGPGWRREGGTIPVFKSKRLNTIGVINIKSRIPDFKNFQNLSLNLKFLAYDFS